MSLLKWLKVHWYSEGKALEFFITHPLNQYALLFIMPGTVDMQR